MDGVAHEPYLRVSLIVPSPRNPCSPARLGLCTRTELRHENLDLIGALFSNAEHAVELGRPVLDRLKTDLSVILNS